MIKNKADIDAKSTDGYTPLQKAALGTPPWQKEGPGVNFNNILCAAFLLADPESANKLLDLAIFFALLVSASVKAARRTLLKLTPGVNFNYVL